MASADFEDQLISQLIVDSSSIDQTAPAVFSAVFAAGRQTEFSKALTNFSNRKDAEIERLCQLHYESFVKSIDELLGLREEAARLRQATNNVLEELGTCGQLLYDTKVEMHETEKMLFGTQKTVAAISECLQALHVAQKATLEIMDRNFGPALRLLDQLQTFLLPRIDSFSFSTLLTQYIPNQLATIKSFALEELKGWLSEVRDGSEKVGELAFGRAQKRIEKWKEIHQGMDTPATLNSAFSMSRSENDAHTLAAFADLVEMEREDAATILNNDAINIDFAPLLRAVHLFQMMDQMSEFQFLFAEYRRAQAKVIFDSAINLKDGNITSFARFLRQICGFFIVEYFILRKPQSFYSPAHVEGLWESATTLINNYILDSVGTLQADQGLFMKIKWLQVFFLHSIEVYDVFSINTLLDSILSLFYRFVDAIKVEAINSIQTSINSTKFYPLSIIPATIPRFKGQFSFLSNNPDLASSDQYPFSELIPSIYATINEYLCHFYVFLEGIPQHMNDLDEMARKSCDFILSECAKSIVEHAANLQLNELFQVLEDLKCLGEMCNDIQNLLISKRINKVSSLNLNSSSCFKDAYEEVTVLIENCYKNEIDQILARNLYELNPSTTPTEPSLFVKEINRFMAQTVSQMDTRVSETLKHRSMSNISLHLSQLFMDQMKGRNNKQSVNFNYIKGLQIDVTFVKKLLTEPAQQEHFKELDQMFTLLNATEIHEFLDPALRSRKYPNITSGDIVQVLQKIKEPADKRRAYEDLILLLQ